MSEFLAYFQNRQTRMIELLTELIRHESHTADKVRVNKLGKRIEALFKALDASSITRFSQNEVGDFLLAKWNERAPGSAILFLIHIDTVWPTGTLKQSPVRVEDGLLYGPGAVDMKGGITLMLTAIRGLRELNQMPDRPIWVLMTTDEEIGSAYSEPLIKEAAKEAGLVMVMEPGTKEGALKMWRKGVATYHLRIKGRAAHAGNAPEQGINSIVEFAHQTIRLQRMNDLQNGISVSVTKAQGGSAGNVIPEITEGFVDTRTLTLQDFNKLDKAILDLTPVLPGAKISVHRGHQRPPMEYNRTMQAAFTQAKKIGASLGIIVRADGSGGGSDGNFTAAMGIPTLDGMGPQGDGLHAAHEHVVLSSLPTRATLIAGILRDWNFAK